MNKFLGSLVILFVIGVFLILGLFIGYFVIDGIYQILDNTIFLAIFMSLISISYAFFYMEGKRLAKRQMQRTQQAVAMTVANRNHGVVTVASFALESQLPLSQCEQILKEMEQRKVLRTSSLPGKMAVYQLDDHVYGQMPYESDDNEEADDEETLELERTQRIRKKRIVRGVLLTVIGTLIMISEEQILLNLSEYLYAAITALIFLVFIGRYLLSSHRKADQRHSEHDVLTYVMDNEGELNPKEIPYYTHESYQSMEPMIDKWHKRNYCSITHQEDGGIIYLFPNYTDESEVYEYDEEYNPIPAWIDKRSKFLLFSCLAFVFSYVGGYALVHWNSLIFILACTIIGGIYGYFAFSQKPELERIERIALQVATKKGGAVAVYELAYNARITMDEAAMLLEKWEQTNIARKVYSEEGAPVYVVSGVVSKEQRLRSEHV
ncbi:DNA primase [Brevibacillus formosus]|uniref:DNA primase n=1 Tax=Brevibacillus TaxID=55080 RepID=UPI000D10C475|nr:MULTISPECIES: DNA primase [Brevibacillus]MBG9945493.1 DNA primase [Brevibacillus formosus]MBW5467122.1 DNA primase [Brevibacillus formosus]MED1943871.1 DNA primase [Brevibacillus formosus]MED1999757.1 DNA primase [Brevibacillus formosus]MED2082106.1 DNA primase [Brevibacillus formosus]